MSKQHGVPRVLQGLQQTLWRPWLQGGWLHWWNVCQWLLLPWDPLCWWQHLHTGRALQLHERKHEVPSRCCDRGHLPEIVSSSSRGFCCNVSSTFTNVQFLYVALALLAASGHQKTTRNAWDAWPSLTPTSPLLMATLSPPMDGVNTSWCSLLLVLRLTFHSPFSWRMTRARSMMMLHTLRLSSSSWQKTESSGDLSISAPLLFRPPRLCELSWYLLFSDWHQMLLIWTILHWDFHTMKMEWPSARSLNTASSLPSLTSWNSDGMARISLKWLCQASFLARSAKFSLTYGCNLKMILSSSSVYQMVKFHRSLVLVGTSMATCKMIPWLWMVRT